MGRVADQNEMIARRATKVVVWTTMPRSATPQASVLVATLRDKALRAVCHVVLLASHPAKPLSRPCRI